VAKYFCPICMFFYDSKYIKKVWRYQMTYLHIGTFKTTCCSQYICRSCILNYCQGKSGTFYCLHSLVTFLGLPETLLSLPAKLPPHINCLYCMRPGVNFVAVNPNEKVKSYEDSPRIFQHQHKVATESKRSDSPLKVGDTFERMKVLKVLSQLTHL
jgi:hypothetical protein